MNKKTLSMTEKVEVEVLEREEANRINDLITNDTILNKEFNEFGMELEVEIDGDRYLLYYDNTPSRWFTEVAYRIVEE